jgi:hypothetical protein
VGVQRAVQVAFLLLVLAQAAGAGIRDEFDDPILKPWWRIVNPDSTHWSLRARPGFLRIVTQYDHGTGNPNNLFFHTEGIPGGFEVTSKLICRPDTFGQYAAIFADFDSLRQGIPYVVLGYGNTTYTDRAILGLLNGDPYMYPYAETLVYFRLSAWRDTVTADFSPDSLYWTNLFQEPDSFLREHQLSGLLAGNFTDLGADSGTPAMNADFDWFHLAGLTGVEDFGPPARKSAAARWEVAPNPVVSHSRVPGHEGERFALYDISGRRVGASRGDRIGEGLAPGVYFLRPESGDARPVRVVKVR